MQTRSRRARATSYSVLVCVLALLLSSCALRDALAPDDEPVPTATPSAVEELFDSQFTRDGTFQSHIDVDGLDFVYTLWPTKSTPRTNEWYPRGDKFFSFTFQAYDLDRRLRDPFATKRKVYLDRIAVTSRTTTLGDGPAQRPYRLEASARTITFDPEPVTTRHGMLITSPKGAFELRNQRIGSMSLDTRGLTLRFTATVWIQERAGGDSFVKKEIRQDVPIAIFESSEPTKATKIPINAN
ncbi:hypothetical protein [Nocardioides ochotonae]|uniref:hypothetical protein n=1 Tax=Nocardioides ochotonae TaxID=2685869 RepID=UPI00140C0DD2|nr:hypothetical protein [Nocardioides ochotonae]